jgi:hypothetical protein
VAKVATLGSRGNWSPAKRSYTGNATSKRVEAHWLAEANTVKLMLNSSYNGSSESNTKPKSNRKMKEY